MTPRRFDAVVLATFAYCAVASVVLTVLLWRYVPQQAAVLIGSSVELPVATRLVIQAAFWFVRLLPLLVLAGIPLAVVAVLVALWLGTKKRGLLRVLLIAIAVALTLASIFVVLAMRWPLSDLRGAS